MEKGDGLFFGRGLILLLGLWLVISPWVFGYARHAHAVNDTIIGVLIGLSAIVSAALGPLTAVPLWTVMALGFWTFVTPMVFAQAGWSFSANNDLVVGALLMLVAGVALVSRARMRLYVKGPEPHAAADQTSLW